MNDYAHTGRRRVLIIDGDSPSTAILADHLKAGGFDLHVISDTLASPRRIAATRPHVVLFNFSGVDAGLLSMCERLAAIPWAHGFSVMVLATFRDINGKLRCFNAGAQEVIEKPFHLDEVVARLRVHLCYSLSRMPRHIATAGSPLPVSREDRFFEKAIKLIQENGNVYLPSHELAKQLGTNIEKLNAIFRERTGKSTHGYVQDIRFERSRHMLANTSLHIQQVAVLTGYRNASDFSRSFRRRYGISPRSFRVQKLLSSRDDE